MGITKQKGQSDLLSAIPMLACSYSRFSPLSSHSYTVVQEWHSFPDSVFKVSLLPQSQLRSQTLVKGFYVLWVSSVFSNSNWHICAIIMEGVDRGGQRISVIYFVVFSCQRLYRRKELRNVTWVNWKGNYFQCHQKIRSMFSSLPHFELL